MSWNSLVAIGLMALLFVGVGCGEDEQTEAGRWINEVLLVNGGFQEASAQGKQRIASAESSAELETAYRSYAEAQRKQLSRFEELDPPDACEDEQADMEQFMREVLAFTEELSGQASLTQARLKEIEGEVTDVMRGLILDLESVARNDGC